MSLSFVELEEGFKTEPLPGIDVPSIDMSAWDSAHELAYAYGRSCFHIWKKAPTLTSIRAHAWLPCKAFTFWQKGA